MLVFKESRRRRTSVSLRARGRGRGPCDPPRLKPWYLGRRRRSHLLRNSAKPTIWPPLSLACCTRPSFLDLDSVHRWSPPNPLLVGSCYGRSLLERSPTTTAAWHRPAYAPPPCPFPLFLLKPVLSLIWLSWTYNKPVSTGSSRNVFYLSIRILARRRSR